MKICLKNVETWLTVRWVAAKHNAIFPDSLKIAKVTPVYKEGSKLESSNYRPISQILIR